MMPIRTTSIALSLTLLLPACVTRTATVPSTPEQASMTVPLRFIGYSVTTRCEDDVLVVQVDEARECLQFEYTERFVPSRQASVLTARLLSGLEDDELQAERESADQWGVDRDDVVVPSAGVEPVRTPSVTDGEGERGVCLTALADQEVSVGGETYRTDRAGEVRVPRPADGGTLAQIGDRRMRVTCDEAVEEAVPVESLAE